MATIEIVDCGAHSIVVEMCDVLGVCDLGSGWCVVIFPLLGDFEVSISCAMDFFFPFLFRSK